MFAWLKKRKYSVSGFIAAFIVISISIFPIFSSSSNATVSVTERVLNVIPLKSKQSSLTTTHIGYITPINSVEVVPNVSGYIQDVLVEGESKTNKDILTGRTRSNKVVNFEGSKELIGQEIKIKIVSQHVWYLKGEII